MLTSAPRHLAIVTFFTVCVILYSLISPSQRLHTVQSTHGLGEKFHSHSHDHHDYASTLDSSPELPDAPAHHHHSIVPTKAPVLPPPSTPSTTDDQESKGSRFSSSEAPDTIDLEPKEKIISPVTPGKVSNEVPDTIDLEPKEKSISPSPPDKVSKIHQMTIIFDGEGSEHDMYERALKGHLAHGERFGYETHVLREDIVGPGESGRDTEGRWKAGVFKKPLYLLSFIINELAKPEEQRAEWIVWVDGDTIILNPNIPFDAFLPPTSDTVFENIHFIGSQDSWGFNCSVFFMRVHEWSVNLLNDVAALPRLRPDTHLFGQPDHDAMQYLFRQEGREDNVVYEPKHWFNGYHSGKNNEIEVTAGDLLVHFAGLYGNNRTEAMGEWFEKAEKEPDTYTVPFEKTKLMDEIAEFWSGWRDVKTMLQEMALGLEKENTTTKYKAWEKLQTAIRLYPWDKKGFGEVMREAQTAMGEDDKPEGKEMVQSQDTDEVVPEKEEQDDTQQKEQENEKEIRPETEKLDVQEKEKEEEIPTEKEKVVQAPPAWEKR